MSGSDWFFVITPALVLVVWGVLTVMRPPPDHGDPRV